MTDKTGDAEQASAREEICADAVAGSQADTQNAGPAAAKAQPERGAETEAPETVEARFTRLTARQDAEDKKFADAADNRAAELIPHRIRARLGRMRFPSLRDRAHATEVMCDYGEEYGAKTLIQWTQARDAAINEVERYRLTGTIEVLMALARPEAAREILEPGYAQATKRRIAGANRDAEQLSFLDHAQDRLSAQGVRSCDSPHFRSTDKVAIQLAIIHLVELGYNRHALDDSVYILKIDIIGQLEVRVAARERARDRLLQQLDCSTARAAARAQA